MTSRKTGTWLRVGAAGLLAVALVAAGGCSKGKATVTGKVKLKDGRPVSVGTISFWGPDNRVGSSALGADGSYTIADAPIGEVKITVVPPPQRIAMAGRGGMPEAPPGLGMPADKVPEGMSKDPLKAQQAVPVNDRYKDPSTTPLKWTVASSKAPQEHDIELDP